MKNEDKDLAAPNNVTPCAERHVAESTKTAQCATGNTKTAQCATGNTKLHNIAFEENTAQLAVRPRKTLQCAEGHAKQSSTSNDRLPEYVAKKVDDRVDVGILNKNTALKAKNKKRGKKCIIL